jgi:hypothetical protein
MASDGAKHIHFSQFPCEKRICFAPSKAISSLFGWCDYTTINTCYFLKHFSFTKNATLTTDCNFKYLRLGFKPCKTPRL